MHYCGMYNTCAYVICTMRMLVYRYVMVCHLIKHVHDVSRIQASLTNHKCDNVMLVIKLYRCLEGNKVLSCVASTFYACMLATFINCPSK